MKIRQTFVSNSSSSSYTCLVCGENFIGRDISYSECEMMCCEKSHEFCQSHFKENLIIPENINEAYFELKNKMLLKLKEIVEKKKEDLEYYDQDYYDMSLSSLEYLIENIEGLNDSKIVDSYKELLYEYVMHKGEGCYEVSKEYCPICNFKHYNDSDIYKFLIVTGKTKKQVFEKIKKRFKTYDDFSKFLRK